MESLPSIKNNVLAASYLRTAIESLDTSTQALENLSMVPGWKLEEHIRLIDYLRGAQAALSKMCGASIIAAEEVDKLIADLIRKVDEE